METGTHTARDYEYQFELRGDDAAQGTLDDPLLRLLNATGAEIAVNDDAAPEH
ncbi:MAG: hypothetical protein HY527_05180 [Betaproteobacteria bacterium]|nr:hypothetical protein [Betaproteobacteria bacterium]